MKKKKKNAQHAETQTQPEDSPVTADTEVVSTEQEETVTTQPSLFNLDRFGKDKIEAAEAMGIPIREIAETMNTWAASVEIRFGILAKNLDEAPKKVIEGLKAEARKQAEQQVQKFGSQLSGQGGQQGGLGTLAQILQMAGGSEPNPQMQDFMNKMWQKSLMGMDLSNAFTRALIIRIAPELAKEMTDAVFKKAE